MVVYILNLSSRNRSTTERVYSHLPTAAPRLPAAQRRALPDNRLEADLVCSQAVQEAAVHLHLSLRILSTCQCTFLFLLLPPSSMDVYWQYVLMSSRQGFNTTGMLVLLCQNDKFSFSFLQNMYLRLAQVITSTASTLGFWYIQRWWKISTKKMVGPLPSPCGGMSCWC